MKRYLPWVNFVAIVCLGFLVSRQLRVNGLMLEVIQLLTENAAISCKVCKTEREAILLKIADLYRGSSKKSFQLGYIGERLTKLDGQDPDMAREYHQFLIDKGLVPSSHKPSALDKPSLKTDMVFPGIYTHDNPSLHGPYPPKGSGPMGGRGPGSDPKAWVEFEDYVEDVYTSTAVFATRPIGFFDAVFYTNCKEVPNAPECIKEK